MRDDQIDPAEPEDLPAPLEAVPAPAPAGEIRTNVVSVTAPASAYPAVAEAPPNDWQRYLVSVGRHKWLVALITVVGTAAGFVATRFLDPRYAAKAILWIESGGEREGGPVASREFLAPPGWIELVTSNAVLDSVVRDLRLYLAPRTSADSAALIGFEVREEVRPGRYRLSVDGRRQFRLESEQQGLVQRGAVGDSVGAAQGFLWAPGADVLTANRAVEFGVTAPYDATQQLSRALKVRLDPGGNFLRVQLKGTNPALTAATVNAVAARVVDVAADLKRQKFEELQQILGGQLVHADSILRRAERALSDFRVRNAGSVEGLAGLARGDGAAGSAAYAGALDAQASLMALRLERQAVERALGAAAGSASPVDALAATSLPQRSPELRSALDDAVAKRAELRALRFRYTDASAPVQTLKTQLDSLERQVIPALARRLQGELAVQEGQLRARVGSSVQQLRRIPPQELLAARLTRDVTSAEELFNTVRQRYEAARLALVSSLPDVRILDAAVQSSRPASDYAPLLVLLACLTSLALAVLGVTVFDSMDPKVRYPEQVTRGMRLSILAAVPHVDRSLGADGVAPVIEALRGLRLRLLHARRSGPVVVTVTSPGEGEGKSFVSANLALSFAHAGYRVVLVDGDIRRGAQHEALAALAVPGLTDVLARRVTIEEALQDTPHQRLRLLSAGSRLPDAPELLLSRKMKKVVEYLRGHADVVIVDSAPLAAGVDALSLATLTGSLLLVFRAGTTDSQLALSKLEFMEALPLQTVGVVLNDVRPHGAYRYYTYHALDEEPPLGSLGGPRRRSRPTVLGGRP